MYDIEICISYLRKLVQLLEEDYSQIAFGFQGEMLGAYRTILLREQEELESAIKLLQSAL